MWSKLCSVRMDIMSFNWAASIYVHGGIAQCAVFWQLHKPPRWLTGKMLFACSAFETMSRVILSLFHVYCTVRCTHDHQLNQMKWRKPRGGAGNVHKVRRHARLKVWTRLWFWPISKSLSALFDRSYPTTSRNVTCRLQATPSSQCSHSLL